MNTPTITITGQAGDTFDMFGLKLEICHIFGYATLWHDGNTICEVEPQTENNDEIYTFTFPVSWLVI